MFSLLIAQRSQALSLVSVNSFWVSCVLVFYGAGGSLASGAHFCQYGIDLNISYIDIIIFFGEGNQHRDSWFGNYSVVHAKKFSVVRCYTQKCSYNGKHSIKMGDTGFIC